MLYSVEWVENKADGWKIVSIIGADGVVYMDVSINKVDKKGVPFPKFDEIAPGMQIQGNIWLNPKSGKHTLFALDPKPAATTYAPRTGGGAPGIKAAQERKAEGIKQAQENKGVGIMIASAFRDATLIAIHHPEGKDMSTEEFKAFHKRIREWYITEWKATEKSQDIPF